MSHTSDRIPELIKQLDSVQTHYAYERRYIGEAMTYLRVFADMLDEQEKQNGNN